MATNLVWIMRVTISKFVSMHQPFTLLLSVLCLFGWAQQAVPVQQFSHPKSQVGNPFGSSPILLSEGQQLWWTHMTEHHRYYVRSMGEWIIHDLNGIGGVSDSLKIGGDASVSRMVTNPQIPAFLAVKVDYYDSLRIQGLTIANPGYHSAILLHKPATAWQLLWADCDSLVDLAIDDSGDLLLLTNQQSAGRIALHQVDWGGVVMQSKALNGLGFVRSLVPMTDGGWVITGSCADSPLNIDQLTDTLSAPYNAYALRLNQQWTATWIRHWDDITCPKVEVAALDQGRMAILGSMSIASNLGDLPFAGPAGGNSDFALMVLDSTGQGQWIAEIPSDTGWVSAILDDYSWSLQAQNDLIVVAMQHKGSAVYGYRPYRNFNGLCLLFDVQQSSQLGQPSAGITFNSEAMVHLRSMALDNGGDLWLSGTASLAVWGASGSQWTDTIGAGGDHDFVFRWTMSGLHAWQSLPPSMRLWPNPTTDWIHIPHIGEGQTDFVIWNIYGQSLESLVPSYTDVAGMHANLSALSAGVYLVKVNREIFRVIKH